jgi:hypothetical protein
MTWEDLHSQPGTNVWEGKSGDLPIHDIDVIFEFFARFAHCPQSGRDNYEEKQL